MSFVKIDYKENNSSFVKSYCIGYSFIMICKLFLFVIICYGVETSHPGSKNVFPLLNIRTYYATTCSNGGVRISRSMRNENWYIVVWIYFAKFKKKDLIKAHTFTYTVM